MPDLSVCVPVHRRHAAPNLATLAESLPTALGELDGELVVALNGISADDAGAPAGVVTANLEVNRGVAPGWNAAARAARGELLCFANDDLLLGEGSLALLARVLRERRDAGVVGPVGTRWDIPGGQHLRWLDLSATCPRRDRAMRGHIRIHVRVSPRDMGGGGRFRRVLRAVLVGRG